MDTELKSVQGVDAPKPTEAEVGQALVEIEKASSAAASQSGPMPPLASPSQSWFSRHLPILCFLALVIAFIATMYSLARRATEQIRVSQAEGIDKIAERPARSSSDPALQAEAEQMLSEVVAGNPGAADRLLARSDAWTGRTGRTPQTDQLIATGINLEDMHAREAALQAQLALDGVPVNESGFQMLARDVEDSQRRTWALWTLGALGSRGVDPVHAVKIIDSYLNDPDVNVRLNAVEGLALTGTDETIPMLEDRFRNDPSPAVQERAICGIAESGMYTHSQRMVAAASLVGWVDDSTLSQLQRGWAVQALTDICGQNFGANPGAWQHWYDSSR